MTSPPLSLSGPLLLVGAGKMGSALLEGWLKLGLDPSLVRISDPSPSPHIKGVVQMHGMALSTAPEGPAPAVAVLAVKPQTLSDVLPALANCVGPQTLVLSILAGKTLAALEAGLPAGTAVIRSMPNTPAAIGRGITVLVANQYVTAEQRVQADALLAASGAVEWIEDEALMDAVTAVSGSGPAYVFLLAEALAQAGVAAGLPEGLSARLARVTVEGAGELLHRSDDAPDQLRRNVTSPGGTTAAALEVLMAEPGLADLLTRAVARATRRGRELGSA